MKIKEVLLGIIIGIVLLMFLVFASKLIYERPEYEDYCYPERHVQPFDKLDNETENFYEECNENYDLASEKYSKNMFGLSLVFGILIIVLSAILIDVNSISGGLMFGSLMFIIYGTGSYWRFMNDWGRFIILGIALGILIYVGFWMNKRGDKKTRKKKKRRKNK